VWFQRYDRGQTNTHTHERTHLRTHAHAHHNTPLPYRGGVIITGRLSVGEVKGRFQPNASQAQMLAYNLSQRTQSPALRTMCASRKDLTQRTRIAKCLRVLRCVRCEQCVKFSRNARIASKRLALNYTQAFCLRCARCMRCVRCVRPETTLNS